MRNSTLVKYGFIWLFFLIYLKSEAQYLTVSGKIVDGSSGEVLIGATVYDSANQVGTFSNNYGFYTLRIENRGNVSLNISYSGFQAISLDFPIRGDTIIDFKVNPRILDPVEVFGPDPNITNGDHLLLNVQSISSLPRFGAEVDVIKSIQLFSGVESGLEGTTNFSVRGGNDDQNLIYLDNIAVYNTGHLGNLVSVFDPYTINNITFYKNGFPAKFGGALSSVTDMYLKEGHRTSLHGEFTAGVISSKLALEGPIRKGKSSFLVSYRRSFYDTILKLFEAVKPGADLRYLNYFFHDAVIKFNFKLGNRDELYLSSYFGTDRIRDLFSGSIQSTDTTLTKHKVDNITQWGNFVSAIRWNHQFSNHVFSNVSVAYTSYLNDQDNRFLRRRNGVRILESYQRTTSYLKDLDIRYEISYAITPNIDLSMGLQNTLRSISPLDIRKTEYSTDLLTDYRVKIDSKEEALMISAFTESNLYWNKLSLQIGCRMTRYSIQQFSRFLPEPRLHSTFDITNTSNVSLEYSRMNQLVSSLNNTGTSLFSRVMIPATQQLPNAKSDQFSVSYSQYFPKIRSAYKIGAFTKSMSDLIENVNPSSFVVLQNNWESEILANGEGYSYGLELSGTQEFRPVRLETNYTLSKSERRFSEINEGKYYPFDFDRRHSFLMKSEVEFSENVNLSLQWIFKSGQPITLGTTYYPAINNYVFNNLDIVGQDGNHYAQHPFISHYENVLDLSKRNNFRMDEYHRMDISLNLSKVTKRGNQRVWNISIYNVYNRMNPYSIFIESTDEGLKFYQYTLFPFLPTFSYSLKF